MNTRPKPPNRFIMTDDDIKVFKVEVVIADGQILVIRTQKQRNNSERRVLGP